MAKVGRPKFIIDYELVEKLANIMCTQKEIATILGCSTDTLFRDAKFSDIYKKGIETGKSSLRRTQFKIAENNASMAIFLGKVYLNQRENIDVGLQEEMSKVTELLTAIKDKAHESNE